MFALPPPRVKELQDTLLEWFAAVKRPLPWRTDRSLYGTWISEVMLQQTTVATVQPYWVRFLERFPDVLSLAAASEQEVLSHWSGLGYYRRARHLHQAARRIAAQGGHLPRNKADWLDLPGIGDYASGAIASLALDERVPAIDANARRVLTRWLVADPGDLSRLNPRRLKELATGLVPHEQPGEWNEAVMELGALVCGARNPTCSACPVLHLCQAGLAGTAEEIPPRDTRPASEPVRSGVLGVRYQGRWLLLPQDHEPVLAFGGKRRQVRTDFSSLHQGLWGLPGTAWVSPETGSKDCNLHLEPEFAGWLDRVAPRQPGAPVPVPVEVGEFRHAVTRYRLVVKVFLMDLGAAEEGVEMVKDIDPSDSTYYFWPPGNGRSVTGLQVAGQFVNDPASRPLSALARKALSLLGDKFG